MSDDITIDDLANAIDAEIRNPAKGMTLGFIRSVDTDRGLLTTEDHSGTTTRRAENVLTQLNAGGSWEINDEAALSDL